MPEFADLYVECVQSNLVADLLPSLATTVAPDFNVFTVLHHGTHEKQLSNLFAWLLDSEGTHRLGDAFGRIFLEEVNRGIRGRDPLVFEPLSVRQEVNTLLAESGGDIADLVLEGATTTFVVENYYTSDGHGHSFDAYRRFGEKDGKDCIVVLLCEHLDPASQTAGWEFAPVVTYRTLVGRLTTHLSAYPEYQRDHPEQYLFLRHMERQFVKGIQVNDELLVDFIDAMCRSGESERLSLGGDDAGRKFGDTFRELAIENFNESRGLLRRAKAALKNHGSLVLRDQVNEALGAPSFGAVSARFSGRYQWTVNFDPAEPAAVAEGEATTDGDGGVGSLRLKFGPSAWLANQTWVRTVREPDYAHIFITWNDEVRQSDVTLSEVVEGLPDGDMRLRDEILALINGSE